MARESGKPTIHLQAESYRGAYDSVKRCVKDWKLEQKIKKVRDQLLKQPIGDKTVPAAFFSRFNTLV